MEKAGPSNAAGAGHAQTALKALNRNSYKISKPQHLPPKNPSSPPLPPPTPELTPPPQSESKALPPQPPVYNIDRNDFRDVVQKLTGSTVHLYPPAPAQPPAPRPPRPLAQQSPAFMPPSRLHRNRPPPLEAARPQVAASSAEPWSPLPPLPASGVSAESPITAYMRRLRSGGPTSPLGFGVLPSPRTACQVLSAQLPTSPGVAMPATSPRLGGGDQ